MRKALLSLLGSSLIVACGQNSSPAGPAEEIDPSLARVTEHLTSQDPIELPGVPDCSGELFTLRGIQRHSLNVVSDLEGNVLHISDHVAVHATGTGLTTGTKYLLQDNFDFSFQTPNLPAPHATQTVHQTTRIIAQGATSNFFLRFDTHIAITGQGELRTTVDHFTIECRGRPAT